MTFFHAASGTRPTTNLRESTINRVHQTIPDQVGADRSSKTDSTPRYVNQVREWIGACDKLHGDVCVPEPIPQRPPEDVPRWLIDTRRQCIIRGISAHRYLALSYVWPETRGSSDPASPAPRTLLLDNATIADFQSPGFLSNEGIAQRIPMVIRHAMQLTHVLGERYLWVDRLCIVQNDLEDGGTLSQVAKMDAIYAGAYLTIIAAAPEEMYEKGMALEWPRFQTTRPRWTTRGWSRYVEDEESLNIPATLPKLSEEGIAIAMSALYVMLSRSRWATRGWTYQEQILCKRAVIFIESGFFWDCHCCVWDGVDLLPGQNFAGIALRADMGQRFSTRWWPDFGFYLDLICSYNGREFSYPQDALLGILGILSALGKSFPGGFIHGLPRLFLDHALLWQLFGTADRRVDRAKDDTIRSSLPSWSWCGWQGFVDPWSLRSGLSYIHEEGFRERAGSWRTRNLVEWRLLVEGRVSEPVLEPRILDQYIDVTSFRDVEVPDGWTRHDVSNSVFKKEFFDAGPFFTYAKDRSTQFKHPVPLKENLPGQSQVTTPAYLRCSTTTATLFPATLLTLEMSSQSFARGPSKISVFEDKLFKCGPSSEKACPILVLQQPNGAFAGLLRLMGECHITEATPFELIAISTGSANARDVRESLEWAVFEIGEDNYKDGNYSQTFCYRPSWISDKGKYALLFDVAMAFDKEAARSQPLGSEFDTALAELERRSDEKRAESAVRYPGFATMESDRLGEWFKARTKFLRELSKVALRENPDCKPDSQKDPARNHWNVLKHKIRDGSFFKPTRAASMEASPEDLHQYLHKHDFLCEFYNVLWIQRREGIAYRRACGWVPKHIWEAHATGPVEVTLG